MASMYKDIYNWIERNLEIETSKILALKTYAFKAGCSDIQAVIENKVCSVDEIKRAIRETYNMDTYSEDIRSVRPMKGISISDMVDNEFIASEVLGKLDQTLVLITKPQAKLAIVEKIKTKINGEITVMYMFNSDFDIWKKNNSTDINDTKLNAVVSNIGVSNANPNEKYDANEEEINSESVVGIVNKLIFDAVNENASDIHIEPQESVIKIRFRVDGILKIHSTIASKGIHPQIVNRIKVLGKMNTNNFQTPQSGKINMTILNKEVDMRISTLPTIYGEKVTIRILISGNVKIRTLEELGIPLEIAKKVRYIAAHPHGIILVSGPTGSGKSSTLASILTEISSTEECLITIEDPVEYKIKEAAQINISNVTGLTFASVLREILRQDPDIIMVGEIRDAETARTAITASNTGHLVFSTIHTNSAVSTITRLVDMGVDYYMIADSLIGVISQRLVKVLCPNCKKEHKITVGDTEEYKLPKSLIGQSVYNPCGCHKCNNGYIGRTIVPEIMEINEPIMEAIHNQESSQFIEAIAIKYGMVKQLDYAYSLVLEGKTSMSEVFRTFGGVSDEKIDS